MAARLAAMISGRGSNMLAIGDACDDGRLDARIVCVISDQADAPGLQTARERGYPTRVVERTDFPDRDAFEQALGDALEAARPDWIALAGFMRVLGPALVARFEGQMLNIHPSLLPKYPGLDTHARALAAGDAEHGATVHHVTDELDAGPIVAQAKVAVLDDDDADTLAARVLEIEHGLYIVALTACLAGHVTASGASVAESGEDSRPSS